MIIKPCQNTSEKDRTQLFNPFGVAAISSLLQPWISFRVIHVQPLRGYAVLTHINHIQPWEGWAWISLDAIRTLPVSPWRKQPEQSEQPKFIEFTGLETGRLRRRCWNCAERSQIV